MLREQARRGLPPFYESWPVPPLTMNLVGVHDLSPPPPPPDRPMRR